MHLNCLKVIFADAATPAAAAPAGAAASSSGGSPMGLLIPMGLMFVIIYFMMIRPQNQRANQQKKLLAALKAGDRVSTGAGIVGVVTSVKDNTVLLRSGDSKMEVTKDSVTQILEAANTGTPAVS